MKKKIWSVVSINKNTGLLKSLEVNVRTGEVLWLAFEERDKVKFDGVFLFRQTDYPKEVRILPTLLPWDMLAEEEEMSYRFYHHFKLQKKELKHLWQAALDLRDDKHDINLTHHT